MNKVILSDIPFHIHVESLMQRARVRQDSPYAEDLMQLARKAEDLARPKAMYRMGYIESRGDDWVVIEGVTLTSRILAVNLEHAHRVFLYVATCGQEIWEWAESLDDLLQRYWAESVQEMALRTATQVVQEHIDQYHHPGHTATMAPGSLSDWPLAQQRPLFHLLGDTESAIGVHLSESLLMIPTKSVSGIRFPTEMSFQSCQLCPRADCPGRRAPYDGTLYDRRYRPSGTPMAPPRERADG
jgi:hypothetical protein